MYLLINSQLHLILTISKHDQLITADQNIFEKNNANYLVQIFCVSFHHQREVTNVTCQVIAEQSYLLKIERERGSKIISENPTSKLLKFGIFVKTCVLL
jgi:hypothetical protein